MDDLKTCIDFIILNDLDRNQGIEYLKKVNLSKEDKILAYSYCYPRNILDYELPKHIMVYRNKYNMPNGWLVENFGESCILVEAFRSLQYRNFMRHLMHSFLDPSQLSSVEGEGEDNCPICGKTVYYSLSWDKDFGNTDKDQELLAIISKGSSVCLCKDCLAQLLNCYNLIEKIEGPDFLTKWKNALKLG